MGNRQRPIDGIHVVELGVIGKAGVGAVVLSRSHLGADAEIAGPALIQEHGTTTVLFERDRCRVAASGELIIAIREAR